MTVACQMENVVTFGKQTHIMIGRAQALHKNTNVVFWQVWPTESPQLTTQTTSAILAAHILAPIPDNYLLNVLWNKKTFYSTI